MPNLDRLPAFDPDSGDLNVIIETTKGRRNKFKYEEGQGLFLLDSMLPPGAVFPYDFGFVPSTEAEDGDPVDVLVLMEEPAFVGCLVRARLIGVLEAEQTEGGETFRNDRLIAVLSARYIHRQAESLDDLPPELVDDIEHFFVSYNQTRGKEFKPLRRRGPKEALEVVRRAQRRAEEGGGKKPKKKGSVAKKG
jgi:inorganic pyrophosphatase